MIRTAALLLVAATAFADSEVGRTFRTVVPAKGVEHVNIEISIGEVTILTSAAAQIEVAGEIRRDYDGRRSRQRAQEIIEDTQIEVVVRGDRATIREKLGPNARRRARWHHSELDVQITLPAGINLEVDFNIGVLDIRGDFGDLVVDMNIGELSVKVPRKNVKELSAGATIGEVHTDVGDRILSREGLFAGKTHFINDSGVGVVDLRLKIGEIDVSLQ